MGIGRRAVAKPGGRRGEAAGEGLQVKKAEMGAVGGKAGGEKGQ